MNPKIFKIKMAWKETSDKKHSIKYYSENWRKKSERHFLNVQTKQKMP